MLIKHTTDSVTTRLIKAKNVFLGPKPGQSTQVITELQLHRTEWTEIYFSIALAERTFSSSETYLRFFHKVKKLKNNLIHHAYMCLLVTSWVVVLQNSIVKCFKMRGARAAWLLKIVLHELQAFYVQPSNLWSFQYTSFFIVTWKQYIMCPWKCWKGFFFSYYLRCRSKAVLNRQFSVSNFTECLPKL